MADSPSVTEVRALLATLEPAARIVPARALRRAIRLSRDRGTFRPRAIHDRCWWVERDQLFQLLTPAELDLWEAEPLADLLLVPDSELTAGDSANLQRTLFHAAIDRAIDLAIRNKQLMQAQIVSTREEIGPTHWYCIRLVLEEQHLIDRSDSDVQVFREFVAFGLELLHFAPTQWATFFPGITPKAEWFACAQSSVDVAQISNRIGLPEAKVAEIPAHLSRNSGTVRSSVPAPTTINSWVERGNDLKAAVLLTRAGDDAGNRYLDRLIHRFVALLDDGPHVESEWRTALLPLLEPASAGDWPPERRLLYELQRACLAVERTTYAADLLEWARSLGRQPIKRPLPKTRWLEALRRLRQALAYTDRLSVLHPVREQLDHLLVAAIHAVDGRAREDLRPDLVAVLDEVGLIARSHPEQLSREKLVEELLDAACARGFLRIGDLRDAIARNRVKLDDLHGPGELISGDPIIRANAKLPERLDGVYRRGEIYMRLLQRGCSIFFGTRPGRALTRYVFLPFGGAFILIEAVGHLYEAAEGVVNWLSGWTATVNGVGLLGGGMAETLADNPTLKPGGASWEWVLAVGIFLQMVLHWPTFRRRLGQTAKFTLVKLPRLIRHSPIVRKVVHNRLTRFFRRYLLLPIGAGVTAALATSIAGADTASVALVGGGAALLAGTFFRTPFGREVEDRFDEAMERVWRVVSVNFAVGVLTLILQFFRSIFEAIDRGIHAVDEGFRFREGQGQAAFVFKLLLGGIWRVFAYFFRFAWNLLVEPQINPIKHFPVVTVSHKILLPLIGPLAKQFGIAKETMATIVFGIPGIFGFLVWELKENWKLYRANAPRGIRPVQVGAHGETVRGLLRPGFHSGTVPKAFARLRKATRAGDIARIAKCAHALEHVAEELEHFADRGLVAYLHRSRRWAGWPIALSPPVLSPNRIVLPFELTADLPPIQIAIDERNGWLIGSVPDIGGLNTANAEQKSAFADTLLGLYMHAGVHFVREQMASVFGTQAYSFDATLAGPVIPLEGGRLLSIDCDSDLPLAHRGQSVPMNRIMLSANALLWDAWVARWDRDAAGTPTKAPFIPEWMLLPPTDPG
jgi:hypothetical protein